MVEVLERGDISFFWRPAVQPAEPAPDFVAGGVAAFFFVLGTADGTHRRVRVGKKRMPNSGERLWARIERAGTFGRAVAGQLEGEHYSTKTRGARYQPGARPIAHGAYAFVKHEDHVHLAYRIDWTEHPDDVPEEVRVPDSCSTIVLFESVPPAKATWTTAGDIASLYEEGFELVLVGTAAEPERELGISILEPPAFAPLPKKKLRAGSSGRARLRPT